MEKPEALEIDGERLEVTPVSSVTRTRSSGASPTRTELLRLGPLVEHHERFPERTNVQLVRPDGPTT